MMPWKNSWFQIALFALLVSGALLLSDYAHKLSLAGRQPSPGKGSAPVWQSACPASKNPVQVPSNAGSVELAQGNAAYARQKMTQAMEWYQKAAAQGNADADIQIGNLYQQGIGVQQSYAWAMQWYEKAADQGNADAEFRLGYMYQNGFGVPQSNESNGVAMCWFQQAAAQGHVEAEIEIAESYEHGWGVQRDTAEAIKWYQKAAVQGSAEQSRSAGERLAVLRAGGAP